MLVPVLKPRKGFTYSMQKPAVLNGKACYVIRATGARQEEVGMPHEWVTENGVSFETSRPYKKVTEKIEELFYIDQVTFHLLQRKAKYTIPDYIVDVTYAIQSEVLDQPLPDNAFTFIVPKGVTAR